MIGAIKGTPAGKSPGPGGFTPKSFAILLGPFLCKVFNSTSDGCPFPNQSLEATFHSYPQARKGPHGVWQLAAYLVD